MDGAGIGGASLLRACSDSTKAQPSSQPTLAFHFSPFKEQTGHGRVGWRRLVSVQEAPSMQVPHDDSFKGQYKKTAVELKH